MMKKMTFAALGLSLLVAAGAQRAFRSKAERVDKGQTMASSDADHKVVGTVYVGGVDPSGLSDEDDIGEALKVSSSFIGTPWETPESREGLVLSADTAEGQLYLACVYARSTVLQLRPQTTGALRPAAKIVSCCEKALALKPGYAEAYIVMAGGLMVPGRYKDAEAALESAVALRPDWASSYCRLAYVLVAQDRYRDALAASQQEARLTKQAADRAQAAGRAIDTGYWGPYHNHSDKSDTLRLDHIQFKLEHPNEVWVPADRIRALHLNHDPIGWPNPDNDHE
jgi:hypothetical protein